MGHATHTLRHRDGTVQLHVHFPSLFQQKPLEIQEENLMEKPLLLRYHSDFEGVSISSTVLRATWMRSGDPLVAA